MFQNNMCKECWFVADTARGCSLTNADCSECPWFKKNNEREED